jgi:type II secretory pathway pseudopilin PulG
MRPRDGARVGFGRGRAGIVLLEALVALTILTVAGVAAAAAVRQSADTLQRAVAADRDLRTASAFLEAVALWPRLDLDRHLGDRPEGAWRLRVDRPLPTLYMVTLTDSTGGRTLLRTALYRPLPPGPP